jgi:hypothetical protein
LDNLSEEARPIVFQQSAVAKRRLGAVAESNELADLAVKLARKRH